MTWTENHFGRISELFIESAHKNGKTYLESAYFTPPFKIMQPFYKKPYPFSKEKFSPEPESERQKKMQIMILSASAGMMAGDRQEIHITAKEGSNLEVTSQAYEKIHKMDEGYAARKTRIHVQKNAEMFYFPLTVIPFAGSSFENETEIFLEDESSSCVLFEILSCGRASRGERFAYRRYRSLVNVYAKEKLIYRENIFYEPEKTQMEGTGMMEGYSHQGSLVFLQYSFSEEEQKEIWDILVGLEEGAKQRSETASVTFGITEDSRGDLVIRMFGNSSQDLEKAAQKILWRK